MSQIKALKTLVSIQRELQDLHFVFGVIEELRLFAKEQQEKLQEIVQADEEDFQQTVPFPITSSKIWDILDLSTIFVNVAATYGISAVVMNHSWPVLKKVLSGPIAAYFMIIFFLVLYASLLVWSYWKKISFQHNVINMWLEEEKESLEDW